MRIADILIGIDSACESFNSIAREMVSPYETASWPDGAPCDLHFCITRHEKTTHLSLNDVPLWHSQDIGEILASFEVHLYQQVITLVSPRYCSIHAAAVALHGSACLFAGISGAGKSSICTKALLSGAAYMSDEFALLDDTGNITPFPRALQWDTPEHPAFTRKQILESGLFGRTEFSFHTPEGKQLTSQQWLPRKVQHQPLPLRHLVLHRYDPHAATTITSIRRSEALMELPGNLHHQFRPDAMLKLLNQRIPQETRFYRLVFSNVHDAWDIFEQQAATSI